MKLLGKFSRLQTRFLHNNLQLRQKKCEIFFPAVTPDAIKDKVALITDGCTCVGRRCAEELLNAGAKGVMFSDACEDRGKEFLCSLAKECDPNRLAFVQAIGTDNRLIKNAFNCTVDCFRKLDIVINNIQFKDSNWNEQIDKTIKYFVRANLISLEYMGLHNGKDGGTVVNIIHPFRTDSQLYPINMGIKEFVTCFNSLVASIYYECTCVKIVTIASKNNGDSLEDRISSDLISAIIKGKNGSVWVS